MRDWGAEDADPGVEGGKAVSGAHYVEGASGTVGVCWSPVAQRRSRVKTRSASEPTGRITSQEVLHQDTPEGTWEQRTIGQRSSGPKFLQSLRGSEYTKIP
ncbi:uncharacterized protein LOC144577022 [Callithrix jacchus]